MGAAKASVGHSEAASGRVGLQRLSSALARLVAGGNARLRLSPHVGELWTGAATALSSQPVQAGVGVGDVVGGVSSFGYSGTIAHALVRRRRVARRRRWAGRRAWASAGAPSCGNGFAERGTGRPSLCTAWAGRRLEARPVASSGQWLVVQPTAAVLLAVGAPLGGVLGTRSWRGVALQLDTADGVAPCVRGVRAAAVRLAQQQRSTPSPALALLTSGAAWCLRSGRARRR